MMYMVTVMADDGTYMDTQEVTVTVTNVDEDGHGNPVYNAAAGLRSELTADVDRS